MACAAVAARAEWSGKAEQAIATIALQATITLNRRIVFPLFEACGEFQMFSGTASRSLGKP
jgi:hypothetical protein